MNRPCLFAGRYYFPDAGRLRAAVESFIEDSPAMLPSTSSGQAGELVALIVPHGPLMEMGPVAGYAYKLLLTTPLRWDVTSLLAPTLHDVPALCCDSSDAYDTPLDPLQVDHNAVKRLRAGGLRIDDDTDDEPVIESNAPFVLSALGNVPVLPLRVPVNAPIAAMNTSAAGLGFVIAAANLPAGQETPACEAIAALNASFFTGEPAQKKRGLSAWLGGKTTPLEKTADNAVLAMALELAKLNGATRGAVLIRKGAYAACALYR